MSLKPAHICGFCRSYCRTGQSRRQHDAGHGIWGSCGKEVEPAQRLNAGYEVQQCYAFEDMRREASEKT